MEHPLFIGIDVAKERLDINVQPSGEAFTVTRDEPGLADLARRLEALGPRLIALEATGGYEIVVAATLAAAALPVVVVNPRQIRGVCALDRAAGQNGHARRARDCRVRRRRAAGGAPHPGCPSPLAGAARGAAAATRGYARRRAQPPPLDRAAAETSTRRPHPLARARPPRARSRYRYDPSCLAPVAGDRESSCAPCQASAPSPPARSSPISPSSATWTAARSRP